MLAISYPFFHYQPQFLIRYRYKSLKNVVLWMKWSTLVLVPIRSHDQPSQNTGCTHNKKTFPNKEIKENKLEIKVVVPCIPFETLPLTMRIQYHIIALQHLPVFSLHTGYFISIFSLSTHFPY